MHICVCVCECVCVLVSLKCKALRSELEALSSGGVEKKLKKKKKSTQNKTKGFFQKVQSLKVEKIPSRMKIFKETPASSAAVCACVFSLPFFGSSLLFDVTFCA